MSSRYPSDTLSSGPHNGPLYTDFGSGSIYVEVKRPGYLGQEEFLSGLQNLCVGDRGPCRKGLGTPWDKIDTNWVLPNLSKSCSIDGGPDLEIFPAYHTICLYEVRPSWFRVQDGRNRLLSEDYTEIFTGTGKDTESKVWTLYPHKRVSGTRRYESKKLLILQTGTVGFLSTVTLTETEVESNINKI